MIRYTHSLIYDFYRKFCRYIKALYDCKNICSRCIHTAKILSNFSFRIPSVTSIIYNFCNNFISIPDSFGILRRYINILRKLLIIAQNKSIIPLSLEGTYNLLIHTLQNINHGAFPALSCFYFIFQEYPDTIHMHCSSCVVCRNKDIIVFLFDFYKTKTFMITDKCSFFNQTQLTESLYVSFLCFHRYFFFGKIFLLFLFPDFLLTHLYSFAVRKKSTLAIIQECFLLTILKNSYSKLLPVQKITLP